MRNVVRLAAAWFFAVGVAMQVAAAPADEVEKFLSGVQSWSADFAQTIDDGHSNVVRSASGKLYLQKPGKFRWDYVQPSEQVILADGPEG